MAWYLLKEDIQLGTHDSIEDARTALRLYGKFEEYRDAAVLETILLDIYKTGREMNYKAPARVKEGGEVLLRSETPEILEAKEGAGSVVVAGTVGGGGSGSGPSTPVKKAVGLAPGVAGTGTFGGGSWTPGKGSPLR